MVDMNKIKQDVSALDTNGKLLLFGGAVGVIGCFLEWWGFSGSGLLQRFSMSGIDSWPGRFAFIGLAAACGTYIHQTWGTIDEAKKVLYPKIQLGGAGLGVLMTVWFWLRVDSEEASGMSVGTSFGMWLTLLASAAATYGAFQRFQATRTKPSP